ncbi:uncharacterized protein [Diadema antillarum]|uniref:uncharacterized protein n=1 Tax=Diadema antillarum TaxID=105358 RepID=UPI003A89E61A
MNTGVDKHYKNKRRKDGISAPLNNGFSLQAVEFSDQPDEQEDEHDDCDDDENTSGQCVPPGTNGRNEARVPDEQHIADVLGSGVAPTPEQRHSSEEKLHATVCSFCRNEIDSLGQRISQSSITGSDSSKNESVSMPKPLVSDPQPNRLTGLDCSSPTVSCGDRVPPLHADSCSSRSYSSPQPLLSHPSVIHSENVRRLREERDEESVTIHGKKSELAIMGLKLCKHDDYF